MGRCHSIWSRLSTLQSTGAKERNYTTKNKGIHGTANFKSTEGLELRLSFTAQRKTPWTAWEKRHIFTLHCNSPFWVFLVFKSRRDSTSESKQRRQRAPKMPTNHVLPNHTNSHSPSRLCLYGCHPVAWRSPAGLRRGCHHRAGDLSAFEPARKTTRCRVTVPYALAALGFYAERLQRLSCLEWLVV